MRKKILFTAAITSLLTAAQPLFTPVFADVSAFAAYQPAQMEYLDRGTVAVSVDGGVYLSWRLLGTENYDTAFDVYRGGEKIATVSDSTNYTDTTAGNAYTVVPSGEDISSGRTVSVWDEQYLTIPLNRPEGGTSLDDEEYTYSPNDITPADVDGDGEYELILKWEPSNSFDSGKDAKYNGNVYIDCYELDGTQLWRIDMGININAGAHFTQIAAYDFDLDGKAELAMKTAPGTIDGEGNYVSEASLIDEIKSTDNTEDYRHSENGTADTGGRVLSGDEYYTVFQGDTGAALDTIYYPHPRGTVSEWGDDWGNRSERYLCAVAYLDGVTPSMIAWRGYYAKTTAAAYNLVNKRLIEVADFDTSDSGNSQYAGNGNHNLTVGDVDDDGCDEVICGALALDNDFSVLWCSGRGHGDALHLADYDPVHEGMEYFSVHEGSPYGMTLYDAATGEEIFHVDGDGDTGAGMMANVGYAEGYYEIWGAGTYYSTGGDNIQEGDYTPASYRFRIFWDGNTYDELLDGTGSGDSNIKIDGKDGRVFTIENAVTNNDTKNNPCLTADILGDWREEIVARGTDNASLVVYTTTKTTEHKLYTLMHDRAYRMQVASQNAGYNQPPHISYYIDEDNSEYDCRKYAAYVTTVHDGETAVRTANLPSEKPDVEAPVKTPEPYQTFEVEDGIITAYDGNTASLTVPETIDGETITGIGSKAFYGNEYLTEVILPDTVTSIGTSAFSGCTALESITMNNVTSFGKRVFYKCAALKSAVIADGTEDIETDIFSGCTALESLTIPREVTEKLTVSSDNITVYGYAASLAEYFYSDNFAVIEGMEPTETDGWLIDPQGTVCGYTGDETELKIPTSGVEVNRIAALAFYNNESIESIVIPEGVTRIDDGNYSRFASSLNNGAFYGCSALKSVEIPQSMEYIGENAFRGCASLESMELPDTVNTIGTAAFYGCTALESAVLPESVESAGSYMLYGCSALKSVTVPDGWTEIPNYMFCGCTSLVSAVLPENSESGGMYLFSGCSALESVNIPAGWTEIPSQMLQGCASLTSIEIPESITDINANAFAESGLQSVSIPDSVTYMGTGAFYMCEALTEVTLSKNTEAICSGSFYGCIALEEIEIPESVTEICGADTAQSVGNTYGDENGAFEGCTALKKAVIPASVTSIGDGAFDGCESLVIYGYTNSEAESYAAANDIEFVSIGTVEKALPCAVSDVSETEDGYIGVTLEISDELWDDKPEELMIIAAFYAEDGTLLSASPEYIGGVSYTFEKASDFYKIFIWDMENMMPYSYAYCNY